MGCRRGSVGGLQLAEDGGPDVLAVPVILPGAQRADGQERDRLFKQGTMGAHRIGDQAFAVPGQFPKGAVPAANST